MQSSVTNTKPIGTIARLQLELRDQLNRHLHDGEKRRQPLAYCPQLSSDLNRFKVEP
jgi:hypothetical protein